MSVRRINVPMPAQVALGSDGVPMHVRWQMPNQQEVWRSARVEHVIESWHVDDAWWTDHPVSRACYACQLDAGQRLILVYDAILKCWYAQRS